MSEKYIPPHMKDGGGEDRQSNEEGEYRRRGRGGGSRRYNDRRSQQRDGAIGGQRGGYNNYRSRGNDDRRNQGRDYRQGGGGGRGDGRFREEEDVKIGEIYKARVYRIVRDRYNWDKVVGLKILLLKDSQDNELPYPQRGFCRDRSGNFKEGEMVFLKVISTFDKRKNRRNILTSLEFINQETGEFDNESLIADLKKRTEFSECCSTWRCINDVAEVVRRRSMDGQLTPHRCKRLHPSTWFYDQSKLGFEIFDNDRCRDLFNKCNETLKEMKEKKGEDDDVDDILPSICFKETGSVRCNCEKFHIIDGFYRKVRNEYYRRSYELMELNDEEREKFSLKDFQEYSMISSAITLFSIKEKEEVLENGEKYDVYVLLGLENEHRKGYEDLASFDSTRMHYNSFGGWNDVLPKVGSDKYDLNFHETAIREFREEVLIGDRFKWKDITEEEEENEGENEKKEKKKEKFLKYGKEMLHGKIIKCYSERKKYLLNNYPVFAVPCEYFDIKKELMPIVLEKEKKKEYLEKTNYCWVKVDKSFFDEVKSIVDSFETEEEHGVFQIKDTKGFQQSYMERAKKRDIIGFKGEIEYSKEDVKDQKEDVNVVRNGKYSIYDLGLVQILGFENILRDAAFNGFEKFKEIFTLE